MTTKSELSIEELAAASHAWSVRGIIISLLIVIVAVIGNRFESIATRAALANQAFVVKSDIIHWSVMPFMAQGMELLDNSILKQAYSIYLNIQGVPERDIESRLSEVTTLDDYHRLIPSDFVDQVNKQIIEVIQLSGWYENAQIFLVVILAICQIFALSASTKLNTAMLLKK